MSTPDFSAKNPDPGPAALVRRAGIGRHVLVLGVIAVGAFAAWYFTRSADVPVNAPAEVAAPIQPPEPTVAFNGLLGTMVDGTPFGETSAYLEMIRAVRNQSPEQFAANPHAKLDLEGSTKDPAAWRGRCVTWRGIIPVIWAERLKDPRAGVSDVWRGVLVETDGEAGLIFDLVDPPPEFEARRDIIEVDGVFLRTVLYERRKGEAKVVPYLLARSVRVVTETLKDAPREFVLGPGIPLAVLVLGGIWLVYRLSTLNRVSKRSMRFDWLAPGRKSRSPLLRPTRRSQDGKV